MLNFVQFAKALNLKGNLKNPKIPRELSKELNKNKKAKNNFANLAPSTRRRYLRWLLMAKTPETRKTRISKVAERMLEKDWRILRF